MPRWMADDHPDGLEAACHHVAPADDEFTARMRFHQSWYRHHVLRLAPGPNPAARGEPYGNILLEQDGLAGRNFLTPEVHAYVEARVREDPTGLEPKRLRNNLLSSQPMCFNLLAPLAGDLVLATRLVGQLPGLPRNLQVTAVRFEYAPVRASHLQDNTAFDAMVEYVLPGGDRGFVGVETKLTEPFSRKRYAFDARYSRWRGQPDWWWLPGAESSFGEKSYNQLWRNHLLAFAMLHQRAPVYRHGYCAVVYHDGDLACEQALQAYRRTLRPEAAHTLLEWRLSGLVHLWEGLLAGCEQRQWIDDFRLRYLDLEASQRAWEAFTGRRHGHDGHQ